MEANTKRKKEGRPPRASKREGEAAKIEAELYTAREGVGGSVDEYFLLTSFFNMMRGRIVLMLEDLYIPQTFSGRNARSSIFYLIRK